MTGCRGAWAGIGRAGLPRWSRRDWAWEFLRRNPEFARDWECARWVCWIACGSGQVFRPDPTLLAIMAKWGLIFRG